MSLRRIAPLAVAALLAAGELRADTWLRPQPDTITVEQSSAGSITVDLRVDDVLDVASVLFDAHDAPSGPAIASVGVGDWWAGLADSNFDTEPLAPPAGGWRVLADLANRPVNTGESGSGEVAELIVDYGGIAPGSYTIALTDTELVDKDAQPIAHQVGALTIIITPAGAPALAWLTEPYAASTSEIRMEAVAADPSGVEYQFRVDGVEGPWQSSGAFADSGLGTNTPHDYAVRARDLTADHNTTGWLVDPGLPTYTLAAEPGDGVPSLTQGTLQIDIAWTPAGNPAGTLYRLEADAGTGFAVVYSGTDLAFAHTGLSPNVEYAYRVQALNGDAIPTTWHDLGQMHPLPAGPGAPIVNMTPLALNGPAPMSLGIEGIALNGNPPETQFAIRVVGTGQYLVEHSVNAADVMAGAQVDALWLTSAGWARRLRGLTCDAAYELQAIARNGAGQTVDGASAVYTTNKCGDANRDGRCSGVDVILARNAIHAGVGIIGVDYSWGFDVNDSRALTGADIITMRNIIHSGP